GGSPHVPTAANESSRWPTNAVATRERLAATSGTFTCPVANGGTSHVPTKDSLRIHAHRAARGDRHHRGPGGLIASGHPECPRGGLPDAVPQPRQADRSGAAQLPRFVRPVSAEPRDRLGLDAH